MKYLSKITPCICAILFLIGQGGILTSCNDDLAADSYYTFTGEMMSDFLANREDFSQFKRIVERAGRMDLLASRGARTLFPPVNSGVEAFLKEKGYASVEDIPASFCDTLVKACLIERTLYTYNLSETHQESNQLDLPLIMVTNGDTVRCQPNGIDRHQPACRHHQRIEKRLCGKRSSTSCRQSFSTQHQSGSQPFG